MTGNLRHRAFTIVELLVVISIIALLIALLMPALGSAREVALDAKCLSNIKQIAVAQMGYASDHNGRAARRGDPTEPDGFLDRFSNGGSMYGNPPQNGWGDVLYWKGYIQTFGGMHCPKDDVPLSFPAQRPYKMSYGLNGYISESHDIQSVSQASSKVFLGETRGNGLDTVGAWSFRAPGMRHRNDRGTYAWFDGHATIPNFEDIWLLPPDENTLRLSNGEVNLPEYWQAYHGSPPSGNWGHANNNNAEVFPVWAFWLND